MLVKSGQRAAMKSLVAGHRGGRKEAMCSHMLVGRFSLGTGVTLV